MTKIFCLLQRFGYLCWYKVKPMAKVTLKPDFAKDSNGPETRFINNSLKLEENSTSGLNSPDNHFTYMYSSDFNEGSVNNSSAILLQVSQNPEFGELRVYQLDGEIWFVGNDVANALGYKSPKDAIRVNVDQEDKIVVQLSDIQDGGRDTLPDHMKGSKITLINESGFYSLTMRSELESAKRFKRWVTSEVLPSIRKTGSYKVETAKPKPFSFEDEVRAGVSWIKSLSDDLRLSDVSKLGLYKQFGDPRGLPTPNYVQSKGVVFSATYLLKLKGIDIGTPTFNNLLESKGILETKTRPSSKGGEKKFRCLTEKGLDFGENQQSPKNPKETQPLYYEDKFDDLLMLIGLK